MQKKVENLGTGTNGMPKLLMKGESAEMDASEVGWLMKKKLV